MSTTRARTSEPSSSWAAAGRCWTLWSADGAVDVEVDAPDDGVLGDVLDAVRTDLVLPGVHLWDGSSVLPVSTPLSAPALRHGAVLGLGRPGPRQGAAGSGALELHVTGGPDAGRAVALAQGPVVLGRSAGCGVRLADPDVSRRHALVDVHGGRVTVTDLGSSNGTTMSTAVAPSIPVGAEPQEWPVGARVRLGSTSVRLTGPEGAPLEQAPGPRGRLLVRPVPRPPHPSTASVVQLPPAPAEHPRRRLGAIAVALPAVGGVLMAWLMSTPQFLFFALLSPLVAVASWASDRLSGRRSHRRAVADHAVRQALADGEVRSAVAADLARREEEFPDPARLAAAARRRSSPLWSRTAADPGGPTVRLGTGPGPTAVTRVEPDVGRSLVPAEHLPVTLPLGTCGGLGITGPRARALATARAVVCQLAVLMSPGQLQLVLVCSPQRLGDWHWSRWLPHLCTVVLPGGALPALRPEPGAAEGSTGPQRVVVVDGPVDAAVARQLLAADGMVRLEVADSEAALGLSVAVRLQATGETGTAGRLRVPGPDPDRLVTVDAVGAATAERIARDLAGLTVPAPTGSLPASARLLDFLPEYLRPEGDPAVGSWERSRRQLLAVLGTTGSEPVQVDLVADGPHALVAGTTGSGKSELLQTLVASLALAHPPDRCSFLLVDYKGGAAFGEAAALPHTVGVLTDLDHQSTARALRSLGAELTRRERLLAEHGARDLAQLPGSVPVGRLVIVVDEFATLAEELPGFVAGLVGIAQRGRSLGVHLVLATQRPAGVVSPEIRANCSLRICLRTTDETDARDVLGSALPAQLPPDRPGRGYLRTGSAAPVLFQVARVSGAAARTATGVTVRRRPWPSVPDRTAIPPDVEDGPTDLHGVLSAVADRARRAGSPAPDRPWLPPLPDRLTAADLDAGPPAGPATRLRIGLVDRPDAQQQVPLELDLATGGGWLVVGGPRSGRTTALRTVLTEAVRRLPPSRLHVHVLDHGGGTLAAEVAGFPHCGTAVDREDPHRGVRLLARLAAEVDRRRRTGAAAGAEPLLLVLVDGYESLAAQLEEAEPTTGAAGLLRLVREGAAVGVTVLLTADRAVPGSRLAAAAGTRLLLPLPDRADYAITGVPSRSVPGHRPPGRALLGEDAVECHLALPRDGVLPCAGPPGTAADVAPVADPIRVTLLPADPQLPLPTPGGAGVATWLLLGPGNDDGTPVGVDLQRTGGLLVVGPPGSGRSTALQAFARHCAAAGAAVAALVPATDDPGTGQPDEPRRLDRTDDGALRAWLGAQELTRPVLVVADDLTRLPDPVTDALTSACAPGGSVLVLAAGTAADLAGCFRGPAVTLRRSRTALVLQPAAGDVELLGLRAPRTPLPARPGAGWLVSPTQTVRVQVARHRVTGR